MGLFFITLLRSRVRSQVGPPKWGFWLKSRNPLFYTPLQVPSNKGLQKKANLFVWFDNRHFLGYNEFPLETYCELVINYTLKNGGDEEDD